MASRLPKCFHEDDLIYMDCFAFRRGLCSCLKDTKFRSKECPFYKPVSQVLEEDPKFFRREYC